MSTVGDDDLRSTFTRHESKPPAPVPNQKKPKSRPPAGVREKIFRSPLPFYSGPYSVGFMDIEFPVRSPRKFSNIKRNHKHVLELETVLLSIYYPSGFRTGLGKSPDGAKKWSRATWLPRPRLELAKGYAKFAGVPEWVLTSYFAATTMFTKLPAYRNATLAVHWPANENAREGGWKVKNKAGPVPEGESEEPTFPLLCFSHGLGGTRTTYSSVCGEFASYGFIVMAIEHRDGSGPRTFINLPEGRRQAPAEHDLPDGEGKESTEGRTRGYDTMDYLFPKHNKYDTAPGNEQGVDAELRSSQIALRLAEIEEAFHVMRMIHAGDGELVAKANLRRQGNVGSSSRGLTGVKWDSWKDRFHLTGVTMLGHSFGAATTVEVLRHADRFGFISQGIIYDIWGAAIQPPEDEPTHRINVPLLGINSEAFMYWPYNFDAVMSLCKEAKDHDALAWLMTVRGSVHISQSDFSILYPRVCSLLLKMTVNSKRALDLNINASLEFLKLVMPGHMSAINRGTNEHLLEVEALDRLPEEHKPEDKWIATKLRIPNEWSIRMTPRFIRRMIRIKKMKESDSDLKLPTDSKGRILDDLEGLIIGEEVWMHVAPTKDELRRHCLHLGKELKDNENEDDGMVEREPTQQPEVGEGHKHHNEGIEQKVMDCG